MTTLRMGGREGKKGSKKGRRNQEGWMGRRKKEEMDIGWKNGGSE